MFFVFSVYLQGEIRLLRLFSLTTLNTSGQDLLVSLDDLYVVLDIRDALYLRSDVKQYDVLAPLYQVYVPGQYQPNLFRR